MPEKSIHVIRRKSRRQHSWVFSNEVRREEGEPGVGDTVRVLEHGRLVGSAMYNPRSLIRARLYSDRDEELDRQFIRSRTEAALRYRQARLPDESDFRLLYGESDGVPGLVIDKYGSHFVVQAYSAGADRRLADVALVLQECFGAASVFEKDDFRLREPEGLERRERLLCGTPERRILISENGVRFHVDIASGQKTGYYYDHRVTRRKVRQLAAGRTVLDVFSYTGSFAVNAALGGAARVLGVDVSGQACEVARANAELNGVAGACEFVAADAFEYLAALARRGESFDLVNLDPPAFIKGQREKKGGLKGYRSINALAMRLLARDGVLVSSSCSHYLFWQDLLDVLVAAAQDAHRSFTILDRTTQGPDHPVLLAMPESEYLRGFALRVN